MYYNLSPTATRLQRKFNKALNTYLSVIQLVPECYETQEICDKAVLLLVFLHLILFLIDIGLKKCVKVFSK